MADPNQAQLAALLALLGDLSCAKVKSLTFSASQPQSKLPGQSSTSVPPPTASGSLDLSGLKPTSSGSGFLDTASSRYSETGDVRHLKEDDCMSLISDCFKY